MAGTTTAIATSFKGELLKGVHNLDAAGNALKMALQKVAPARTYDATTTNISALQTAVTDEVANGSGYVTGGAAVTNSGVSTAGTTGIADFGNVSWAAATFSATAAHFYNSTQAGKMIAMWDFGGTQTVTASTFLITMPGSGAGTSLIRVA